MIETQIFSILSNSPALIAQCASRIYPLVLPDDAVVPAISYSFVGGSSKSTQDTRGNQKYRLEVNAWASKYLDAINLRSAVIDTLDSYSDQGIYVTYLQPIDFFEHELLQYRSACEFYVFFNR
jgi:hypothetical protein